MWQVPALKVSRLGQPFAHLQHILYFHVPEAAFTPDVPCRADMRLAPIHDQALIVAKDPPFRPSRSCHGPACRIHE